MGLGKMEVAGRSLQVAMAEQDLQGLQVHACFQLMRCEAVANQVRRDMFRDASTLGGELNGGPYHLGRDRAIDTPALVGSREEIRLGPHPTPVLAQRLE